MATKRIDPIRENTIAQFFADSGFIPPKGRDFFDVSFGFDTGTDADMTFDGYDGIPDTILDVGSDLDDGSEHPAPGIYGDFYMFNDPGTRSNPDLRTPLSSLANQTNTEYHKKDLSLIQSASDVHLEPLEQPAGEFPRHQQVRSQMEPSQLGPIDQSGLQPPQPGEIVLQQPTIFEGKEYPAGTRIIAEAIVPKDDAVYEDPNARICPLCHSPYVGDACPCAKDAFPGEGAIRVNEKKAEVEDELYSSPNGQIVITMTKNGKYLLIKMPKTTVGPSLIRSQFPGAQNVREDAGYGGSSVWAVPFDQHEEILDWVMTLPKELIGQESSRPKTFPKGFFEGKKEQ